MPAAQVRPPNILLVTTRNACWTTAFSMPTQRCALGRWFGADAHIDFSSNPDSWGKEIETWRELGGTHLSLRTMDTASQFVGAKPVGYSGPADYIDALETFWKAVQ